MRGTIFFVIVAVIFMLLVGMLLRSRKLREKYAALWIVVGLLSIALALFPALLAWSAQLVGVQVPSNLLFVLAIGMLLGVVLQLSLEVSRIEDRMRVLAEHVAILDAQNRDQKVLVTKHDEDPDTDDKS